MKNLIIQDEKALCSAILKKPFRRLKKDKFVKKFKDAYFIGDDSFLCDFFFNGVSGQNRRETVFKKLAYVRNGEETTNRECVLQENPNPAIPMRELLDIRNSKSAVFFFADCVGGIENKEKTIETLQNAFSFMRQSKNARMVVTALLPKIEWFKDDTTALSEREYNFYIEKVCDKTPEVEYYLSLEKLCREAVRDFNLDIVLVRYDNVFASDRWHTPSFDLHGTVKECINNKVVITDQDCVYKSSLTYVPTACYQIFYAFAAGRKGHVYNGGDKPISKDDIKQEIYKANTDVFSISRNINSGIKHVYNCLNSLKITRLCLQPDSLFANCIADGIKHVVSYVAETEYDTTENVAFYDGKIKNIQALETKILLEIDRICRKHDIKYFLAGGSLLGAVREKGAIEWDDDLDIGMLREDLEKFRKVVESELSDEFYLSGPLNKSGSHYTLDKIRLKDTYFSTNFSSHSVFRDGIFCDVLVYDKTSNNAFIRRLHRFILAAFTKCTEIKWYNEPRRGYYYRFSKIMLPIFRLIPWGLWHRVFEFFATLFKHQKNAKWLIDTAGKKVNDDPMPNEGLHDIVYVDYENIKAPIPIDSYPYLFWVYGARYMEKPALCQRRCPHNFGRIDLGKYVFDIDGKTAFREVDIRGELFENEEEI